MKVGIVAGEKSGDYLGAQLIRALRGRYPNATFTGICGPLMQAEGAVSTDSMDKLSVMGLEGLIGSVWEILAIRKRLLKRFMQDAPDLFIGIDAPDFNLTLEKRLRRHGIKTVHYVSPTVWAWRGYRIRKIQRAVDLMLTLFPFEAEFYRRNGVPVAFVGHPLAEILSPSVRDDEFRARYASPGQPLVALLPGSRTSEVKRLGRIFAQTAVELKKRLPGLRFVVPMASSAVREVFISQCGGLEIKDFSLVDGQSQQALAACDFAILASGTAALEAGLLGKPMIVAYRISSPGYWFVKRTLTVEYASMPNHLLSTHPVPEFIHDRVTIGNLLAASLTFLENPVMMQETADDLARIYPELHRDSGLLAVNAIVQLLE